MFQNVYTRDLYEDNPPKEKCKKYKLEIVWLNVIVLTGLHLIAVYGFYLWFIEWQVQFRTFLLHFLWALCASFGITGGAHRLWAHRCYKANLALRVLYAILMSMIFANDIYTWVRDHRAHHKFTETDADPHNARRGFFFSHCGWLLVRRHPDVVRKGAGISYADLEADAVVMFHRKYYGILMPLGTFIIPTLVPWYFWDQPYAAVFCIVRYLINIHIVWSLNSFAHMYGMKPYNKYIYATENKPMMYLAIGEGFHNYHHTFPWDYKASEFHNDARNLSTYLIDCFARIGWASEMKEAPARMVEQRALRTGDGSWRGDTPNHWEPNGKLNSDLFWGWDDPDIPQHTKNQIM